MDVERGSILLIEFDPTKGSEIQKTRPAVVLTNNVANQFSPVITVAPITSQKTDIVRIFEVFIDNTLVSGLKKPSKAVIAQLRTVDRSRIQKTLGKVSKKELQKINTALKIHLDLDDSL